MRRIIGWIKKRWLGNLCAFFMYLSSPMAWTSPFAAAFLGAAGYGEMKWDSVLVGSALGAFAGKGGFGGLAGGLMAYTLCGMLKKRDAANPQSLLALTALGCCLFPACAYHLPYSVYDTVAATFASVIAMAACPAIAPICAAGADKKAQLSADERVAAFIMSAMMLTGLTEWYAPAGCFFAGLFALVMASGGMFSSLIGALTAAVGLLMGSASPIDCALLFLLAAASGAVSQYGAWAQSAAFLIGIPLSAYFGFHAESASILASAAVYPCLPRAFAAQFCRSLGFFDEKRHVFLTARTSRRHIAPHGMTVSGDAGLCEHFPDGRMMFVLADGMGTGQAARKMSDRVIGYARDVFQSPLTREEAMLCINALSNKETDMHSTLDICLIDTVTGDTEFIKNGAEPCWILSRYEIKRFEGEALPVGALQNAPSAHLKTNVAPGDSIFMATDGLINALGGADAAEKILFEHKALPPAGLCTEMIRRAKDAPSDMRRDDMSALCIKIGGKSAYPRAILRLAQARETEKKAG